MLLRTPHHRGVGFMFSNPLTDLHHRLGRLSLPGRIGCWDSCPNSKICLLQHACDQYPSNLLRPVGYTAHRLSAAFLQPSRVVLRGNTSGWISCPFHMLDCTVSCISHIDAWVGGWHT